MTRSSLVALLALAGVPALAAGQAGDANPTQPSAAAPTTTPPQTPAEHETLPLPEPRDEVRLTLTPYIWMASLSGDLGIRGTEVDASKNFVDIIRDSDLVIGLMGEVDLEYHRWVFQFNGAWSLTEVKDTNAVTPSGTIDADATTNTAWFELFGGYRVLDEPLGKDDPHQRVALDLFVGGRVTVVDTDLDLRAASDLTLSDGTFIPANTTHGLDATEEWFEPFVGARVTLRLTERWAVILRGDVGGFDVDDSQFAWQAVGAVGYWWKTEDYDIGLFAGYRALGQDYDSGDFAWDITTHGPLVGAAFKFSF